MKIKPLLQAVQLTSDADEIKIWRCPYCNTWEYDLLGKNLDPGLYQCDECGYQFEIPK